MNNKLKYGLLIGFPSLAYFVYRNYPKLNILTGFSAKNVCSSVFEAERELESIEAGDNNFLPVYYAKNTIDFDKKTVSSSIMGLKKRLAIYQNGLGSLLLPEDYKLNAPATPQPKRKRIPSNLPYPYGEQPPKTEKSPEVNYPLLQQAIRNAFDGEGENSKKTRAVLVFHKDKLIGEKYAEGFSKNSKLLGWSMTKSITSAVLGILEKQGKVSLQQKNLFKEWENDKRANITLNNLLQMNSGLEWKEDYATISDVNKMLFMESDMSRVQLKKSIKGIRGENWKYSSGTTNLLSAFIRNQFNSHQEYLDFWYKELIDKIGMNSMTLETDLAGNYVGSSYAWATARDWAKFGLLYLNKGKWNGEQILNPSWVNYTSQPASGSNGEYGAHFWLNAEGKYPNVPKDMFSCNGFQGQYIFIIPSKKMLLVRFGLTEHPEFHIDDFIKEVLGATS